MNDLFRFNNVNLDILTETFNMPFYLQYMSRWPELFTIAEAPDNSIMGYMLGKSEGRGRLWHGHVSAVTVAPLYRRLGLAKMLMEDLESTSAYVYNAYFVDLFVRSSNRWVIYQVDIHCIKNWFDKTIASLSQSTTSTAWQFRCMKNLDTFDIDEY